MQSEIGCLSNFSSHIPHIDVNFYMEWLLAVDTVPTPFRQFCHILAEDLSVQVGAPLMYNTSSSDENKMMRKS